jgi:hypothetical protein
MPRGIRVVLGGIREGVLSSPIGHCDKRDWGVLSLYNGVDVNHEMAPGFDLANELARETPLSVRVCGYRHENQLFFGIQLCETPFEYVAVDGTVPLVVIGDWQLRDRKVCSPHGSVKARCPGTTLIGNGRGAKFAHGAGYDDLRFRIRIETGSESE